MTVLFLAVFFVFGLIIGSFLNVVIYRYNTKKSLGGRSACMSCQSKLSWYELIPLISFLTLQGRCKTCKTKISVQYPLVELATGTIFTLLFFKFSISYEVFSLNFLIAYIYYAVIFSLLLVITVYDMKHKIIPDLLVFIFSLLAFLGLFFFGNYGHAQYLHMPAISDFLSGIYIALPFAFFWLVSRGRWMGLGDAKLALGIGWLLGMSAALSALVISFWTGAILGVLLIVFRKGYNMKSEIPFAPYLVLGTFVAFIFELCIFLPLCSY